MTGRGSARGIVVDTSAAFAMITGEPSAGDLRTIVASTRQCLMSAASLAELGVVMSRRFAASGPAICSAFVFQSGVEVVPVDQRIAMRAIEAHYAFGNGRHPARLNYGDCFTYATAAMSGLPILCVGTDFARTDVEVVSVSL